MRTVVGALIVLLFVPAAVADDWPRWRGPRLNGISEEKGWLDRWPKEGPRIAWKANVGTGFELASKDDLPACCRSRSLSVFPVVFPVCPRFPCPRFPCRFPWAAE
jgi:hypothetical protein